ncbi:MAG TPA: hypothetical protein VF771_07685 [Longimicrobiaceae bacterium]
MGEPAYKLDLDRDNGFTLRVEPGVLDSGRVSRFLDYLILEATRERSQLTREEAAEITDEIDRAVWERVRHEYEEE